MTKVRQDAWSHEDDLLLAETVLRHIRDGSTQLNAFDEVGDKLNRTSAACGFRWNAEVRQNYEQAVQIAKKQRKEKKRALAKQKQTITQEQQEDTVASKEPSVEEEVYSFLNWNSKQQQSSPKQQENYQENYSLDLDQVIRYLQYLKKEYNHVQSSQANQQQLLQDHEQLKKQLQMEQRKNQELERELTTMKEDYQAFMQIVERARKMVVFDETETRPVPTFRMDKNGNLEQVAK
ncbi:RsfA family transcriptional regulator [Gracilibacillus alcaliphilus]|uniref:RsfA family transcriptional regulator n=1 Tax=Gracilibacillus alcaliphilus TaxID=1401441 RepID=UPI001957C146|nr:RsfA family transcriptional regulator [Gracilibacillus alcaliphilus]MBM7679381.1 prespore-specific regulator [Gracilibacillus alcaliphilus]